MSQPPNFPPPSNNPNQPPYGNQMPPQGPPSGPPQSPPGQYGGHQPPPGGPGSGKSGMSGKMIGLIVGIVVLLIAAAVLAFVLLRGDDDSKSDKDGDGSVSVDEYCKTMEDTTDTDMPSDYMEMSEDEQAAYQLDQAEKLKKAFEDNEPPEEMPEDAKKGLDVVADALGDLSEEDMKDPSFDPFEDLSTEDKDAYEALESWITDNCDDSESSSGTTEGETSAPESVDPSDLSSEMPTEIPSDLSSFDPSDLPSFDPSEMGIDPDELQSQLEELEDLASDLPTNFPSN